jgi:CheY-like chemotaxis protein
MLPRVFDLFMQVDRGADRAQGGLGIGLTLVKSLVEMHGGSVGASSAGAGQGSEFVVRLPLLAAPRAREEPPEHATPAATLAPRRVLVVDDNHDAADSMGLVLKMLGADARVVYSGPEALAALESWRADVMLLDVGMPGMDGHEVARRVRQRPDGGGVTLIAVTGWGQEEDVRRTRRAGFDHHLVKPVDVAAVAELLGSTQARAKACPTSPS